MLCYAMLCHQISLRPIIVPSHIVNSRLMIIEAISGWHAKYFVSWSWGCTSSPTRPTNLTVKGLSTWIGHYERVLATNILGNYA
jgi:hypothetical protein